MKKLSLIAFIFLVAGFFGFVRNERIFAKKRKSEELYFTILPKEAKKLMDENKDCVILDVRRPEEFALEHIPNAISLPLEEIEGKVTSVVLEKSQMILVYCRSGRRSAMAAKQLSDMGYKLVFDFGGVLNWPYETV